MAKFGIHPRPIWHIYSHTNSPLHTLNIGLYNWSVSMQIMDHILNRHAWPPLPLQVFAIRYSTKLNHIGGYYKFPGDDTYLWHIWKQTSGLLYPYPWHPALSTKKYVVTLSHLLLKSTSHVLSLTLWPGPVESPSLWPGVAVVSGALNLVLVSHSLVLG